MAKQSKRMKRGGEQPSEALVASLERHRARGVPMARVSDLVPWIENPRDNAHAVPAVVASLQTFGWTSPVLYRADGRMVEAGHTRLLAAAHLGLTEVPAIALDHTDHQARLYALADNRLGELAEWSPDVAQLMGDFVSSELATAGWDDPAAWLVDAFGDLLDEAPKQQKLDVQEDEAPEPPKVALVKPGDVWVLGRHRLICGASGSAEVGMMLPRTGKGTFSLVTDPPYCSGGFQEASRASGSVGVRSERKKVANDRLSSRGFEALIRSVLEQIRPLDVHIFTDWRQWSSLFDAAESSGISVRSMVVWAKPNPGLGGGWRPQHELILYGSTSTPRFDRNRGNVIQNARQRNELHTTQKPVALMAELVAMAEGDTIVDTFAGSGTTLIAAEQLERPSIAIELDPAYCDTIIERWQTLTGGKAVRESEA